MINLRSRANFIRSMVLAMGILAIGVVTLVTAPSSRADMSLSWIDLRLDKSLRPQLDTWERQMWGDDPALSSRISHEEVWGRVPEVIRDEDTFVEQWNARKQKSSDHPRDVLRKQRVHVVESSVAFSVAKRLIQLAAFNESGRFDPSQWDSLKAVSEDRVRYAVRSVLIEIALQLKLIPNKAPLTKVPFKNSELYSQFYAQFGNEKNIEVMFDWKESADQLGRWIESAQKSEGPLKWAPVKIVIEVLPRTLVEFEDLIRDQLQVRHTEVLQAHISRKSAEHRSKGWGRLMREYSGTLPKRAEMVAADLSQLRKVYAAQSDLFKEWQLTVLSLDDGGPMSETLYKKIKEIDEKKLSASDLTQLKNPKNLKGWNLFSQVRVNTLGDWESENDHLPAELKGVIAQMMRGFQAEGQVVSSMIPVKDGLGWIFIGVTGASTLSFDLPGVQSALRALLTQKVESFVLRDTLRVALTKNPASFAGSNEIELGWPSIRIHSNVLVSKIFPIQFTANAPKEWMDQVKRGDRVLTIEELEWVQSISLDGLNRLFLEP